MGPYGLCVVLIVGIVISQGEGLLSHRDERNFIGDSLGAISKATGLDSAVTGVTNILGAVESTISPSAMYNFCHQNGYTQWRGSGPEPPAPSGAIGGAWSAIGSITGGMVGSWAPDVVFQGKCHPQGWFNPSEPGPGGPGQTTVIQNGSPGYTTTQYIQGGSPQYTVLPGSPGYTTEIHHPGSPPTYSVNPGSPGYITTSTTQGNPPQYNVNPGSPGYITTTTHPGTPPQYSVNPGSPGFTTTVQYPPTTQQCCPCNG